MTDAPLQFEFEYRREDETFRSTRVMRRASSARDISRSKYGILAYVLLIPITAAIINGMISLATGALLILVIAYWARLLSVGTRINDDEGSPLFGHKTCIMDDAGITIDSPNMKVWVSWPVVRDIEESPKHISIYYDLVRAIVLPKASFKTEADLASFREALRRHAAISRIGQGRPVSNDPISRASTSRRATSMWIWFIIILAITWNMVANNPVVSNTPPQVDITVTDTKIVDGSVVLLGKVHNTSKDTWSVNSMEVTFYEGDKFIDQCDVYSGMLVVKGGETQSLKASCGLPVRGDANRMGTIMPDTLKKFTRVEVKAKSGYKSGVLSLFGM